MTRKQQKLKRRAHGIPPAERTRQRGDTTYAGPAASRNHAMHLTTHISAVPQRLSTTLAWSKFVSDSVAAGVASERATVILNSPFDPDAALGGISAQGFAKLMAFYSKCFTLRARISVQVVGVGVSQTGIPESPIVYLLGVTTNSTSLGSLEQGIQEGLSDYQLVNCNPDRATLFQNVDIGAFLGKPDVLDDPQLFCTNAANPGQVVVGHFFVANGSSINAAPFVYLMTVEYDVCFTDPVPFT